MGPASERRATAIRWAIGRFSTPSPKAYETLLWDVLIGDATLFMRADQVEAAWQVITPILNAWQAVLPVGFPNYASGTWGPSEALSLPAEDGHYWEETTWLSGHEQHSNAESTS